MTDRTRFDLVRRLFDAARRLSADERDAFLAERCGSDTDLRAELESLLVRNVTKSDLDTPPIPGGAAAMLDGSVAAETLDRYELGNVLGEGGFGVVYEAQQTEPVRRRVAVKIIKPGMDSRAVITRFESERQTLALMNHPGVARVFDGGVTHQGRPYFAMELVDGSPITRYCDERSIPPRDRVALMIRVCDALQHAHTKGVIHRDLKPGNILVAPGDDGAQPKIIDFGIAKALEDSVTAATALTRHGQMIGTPEYMSPEQACGGVTDTRTDVYAIGVVLYELLTGVAPFETPSGGLAELQRVIRDVEPMRPSTKISALAATPTGGGLPRIARERGTELRSLTSMLRRDLDWIVMRCLEKDPERRYATASALAEDLHRFLANEPVLAGPPSTIYRAEKFVRRNRSLVFGASAVVIALLVAVVGTSFGLARALHAESAATDAATIKEAINTFLNEDLLSAVDPARAENRDVTMREVLDAASERIEGKFLDQPEVEAELRTTLANTYWRLGEPVTAEAHRRRAIELLEQVYGPEAEETIAANHALTAELLDQGRLDEALAHTQAELEFLRRVRAPSDRATLQAVGTLGTIYLMLGRFDDAIPLLEESLADKRANLGPRDPSTLTSINNLAGLYMQLERIPDALELYHEAHDGRCAVLGVNDPKTLGTAVSLGYALIRTGLNDEAEPLLLASRAQLDERLGPVHRLTLLATSHLALIARESGRFEEAERLLRSSLDAQREHLGPRREATINSMVLLGAYILRRGGDAEARDVLEEAVTVGAEALAPGHWQYGMARLHYGVCLMRLGDLDSAEASLSEACCILDAAFGADHPRTQDAVDGLVDVYTAQGRPEQSEALERARAEDRLQALLCGPGE